MIVCGEFMLISVIIPIYNVEPYLRQCIDSVVRQTYQDLEIILVDDGSKDRSPQICEEYSKKDSRVKVIHKPNGGLSDARNAGIQISSGDYGIFLDSDDYWTDKEAIQKLVTRQLIKQSQVLSFSYHKFDEKTGQYHSPSLDGPNMPQEYVSRRDQLFHHFSNGLFISSAWNKLIAMDLLKNLPFERGRFSEDVEWTCRLLIRAKSFDYINERFYCYRQRSGSIAHSITDKNCSDLKDAILSCWRMIPRAAPDVKTYVEMYTAYQLSTFIAVQSFTKRFQKVTINEAAKASSVLEHHGKNRKIRYMYYGVKLMGFTKWCRFIRKTMPIWNKHRNLI